jgi:hypothetical protein
MPPAEAPGTEDALMSTLMSLWLVASVPIALAAGRFCRVGNGRKDRTDANTLRAVV